MGKYLVCDPGSPEERQRIMKLLSRANVVVSSISLESSPSSQREFPMVGYLNNVIHGCVSDSLTSDNYEPLSVEEFIGRVVQLTHAPKPPEQTLLGEEVKVSGSGVVRIGCLTLRREQYNELRNAIINQRCTFGTVNINYKEGIVCYDGNNVSLDSPELLATIKHIDCRLSELESE